MDRQTTDSGEVPVTILLVDDDPASVPGLETILGRLGARLASARDGEEALRMLQRGDFAAVLVDVRVAAGGIEAARLIGEWARTRGVPLLFLAGGEALALSAADAYALGAVDYLEKPLLPEVLRAKAAVFIDQYRRVRSAARAESEALARLENVLATVNDAFVVLDRELRYTYVNERMVRLSGMPREQFIGRRLADVSPDLAGSFLETELRRAIDEQTPVSFAFHHASDDRWFENRAYPSPEGLVLVATDVTEAKRAEELRNHLAAIIQSSEDAVISKRLDGTIASWNRGAERLFGYAAEEIVGRPISVLVPEDSAEDVALILGQIREGKRVEHYETRRRRKDGTLIDVALTVSPVHDASGRIVGASKIARDITEQRRAAAARQALQAEREQLLERMPIAYIAADAGGRITGWNPAAERIFGYSAAEALGKTPDDLFLPESARGPAAELRRRLLAGDMDAHGMTDCRTKDGRSILCEWHNTPLRGDGGEVVGTLSMALDVTGRIAAERALREQAGMLDAVLGTSVDHIYVFDREGRHVRTSEGAARVLGRTREEVVGKTWRELGLPAELTEAVDSQRTRVLATGRAELHEARFPTPDGLRLFEYYISPVPGEHGWPEWAVVVSRDITERRRAEDALKSSEERFRLTADHAPVLIWIAGADMLCTWLNKPWLDFTGRTMEQEYGHGWSEGVHPEDFERWFRVYATSFEARAPFKMEYRLRHHSGEYRWVIDDGIPLYGPGGEFTGYIGSCVDIHARKLAEERQALLAEAGRILGSSLDYEVTLSQLSQLVVPGVADWCGLDLVTDDGRVRRLAVVHKDPAKVELATEFRRRYPPRPEDRGGLMAVLATGEPILHRELTDEQLVQGARDPEQLAMLRALGLRSFLIVPMTARGRTLGALTLALAESSRLFGDDDLQVAREIASRAALAVDNARLFSEAREAAERREEALRLHRSVEQQLTLLVEASGSLSVSLDLHSVLDAVLNLSSRLISADAYAVWRYEPSAAVWGIAHGAGLSKEYRESTIREMSEAPTMPEAPIVAEDVMAVPVLGERERSYQAEGIRSLLAVPLKVRGAVTGTLVFYYRSTHRFSEVEVRVATALANLAGSAVGIAELYGELRENGRRKDEFLAMLAHELRNPLSAIANSVTLLERPELDDEGREWATQVISRQVRHLSRLMDDLLDVSRVSRGKIVLKTQRVDAATVIRQAIETAQPLIHERKHKLNVSYDPGALELEADPTRLEQIIVNLLTNAAKYTEAGGSIWLSARRDDQHIAVSVRDDGIGIAPEQLPRMFELFAQGDRSLARSEGGLGIGLTLVKSLAELHGGGVVARSEGLGKGSEFIVRLPAAKPRAIPAAEGPRRAAAPTPGGGRKILVIDDNVDTARGMSRLLRLLGHELRVAHGGPEGIEAALAFRPDVILLDIGLPGMDGYQVARRFRREQALANVLIIAVSGYGQEEDRERSRSAGIDHHLVKPVDHETLVTLIAAP